jgi:hypothetical protein
MRFLRITGGAAALAALPALVAPSARAGGFDIGLRARFSQMILPVEVSYSTALNPPHPLIEGDFR